MGMKNHELVNTKLIAMIAQLAGGGAHKILMRLSKERLVAYERGKHCRVKTFLSPLHCFAYQPFSLFQMMDTV